MDEEGDQGMVDGPAFELDTGAKTLDELAALCREAAAHTDAPLLELRGLESVLLDSSPLVALLDRPRIPPHEIAQEMPRADWRCASLNPNPNPTLTVP